MVFIDNQPAEHRWAGEMPGERWAQRPLAMLRERTLLRWEMQCQDTW